MVLQNWILPFLIGVIAAYLLMSILYNNSPILRQKFSDLGAIIQLQTSRPAYYFDYVPQNDTISSNIVGSRYAKAEYVNGENMINNPYLGYLPNPHINPHVNIL